MDMMRHHDESTSLLPKSREGYNCDESAAAGGPSCGHHHHRRRRRVQPKPLSPRLAGLVVGGVAVAIMVAAAVFVHDVRGGASDGSGLHPTAEQPPMSLSEKNTIAPHGEARASSTPASSLGVKGAGDGSASRDGGGGGDGGDGGGGEQKREEAEEEEETAPNVIFILVDDLGMNDMGSSSTDMADATPFIDSLAMDGVRITRYYTNHICTPARVSYDGFNVRVKHAV